ncbi:type I restriction endonuclease subunit R [Mycoplasmopsis pulmonis]|nr:type I restriction endonuclease subunit R [Mycoplasmopsis pulmonis]MDZ7293054.1 type I restriction endonuclease subunit R [Mycoplasmopsis pulmonis]
MKNERNLEDKFIDDLKALNYEYIDKDQMFDLRKGEKKQIILHSILEQQLEIINKNIKTDEIYKIQRKIDDLLRSNVHFRRNEEVINVLKDGVTIYRESEQRSFTWKIIDFENSKNNSWIVTNQFEMISSEFGDNRKNIPDIVIYLNGLPIIVGELKTYYNTTNELERAENQIKNYALSLPELFAFNWFSFISNFIGTKIGDPIAKNSHFNFWIENQEDKTKDEVISKEFWDQQRLLDFFKYFIFYNSSKDQKNIKKIIARHYQYFSVKETLKKFDKNSNKVGIVWHVQGSGKSLTMVMLTKLLRTIEKNLTVIVVTDRIDLQDQLNNTFNNFHKYIGEESIKIKDQSNLKYDLEKTLTHGIYFVNIQKFRDMNLENLNTRSDILIISDEAHRSHNNFDKDFVDEKLALLDSKNINSSKNKPYSRILRDAFPNAKFIGFTGTPIENKDIETKKIFGDYIHIYSMANALEDGAIVVTFYENSKIRVHLSKEQLDILDKMDDSEKTQIKEQSEIKIKSEATKYIDREKHKEIKKFLFSNERLEKIANHFIKHYEQRKSWLEGKAMFVAYDRRCAFNFYQKILEKKPDWKNIIKLIVTPNTQKDSPEMTKALGTFEERKNIITEFKKPDSEVKILIVVDMLLTGYDVPSLDTIYFDKFLKMHSLMQAIARVNRPYKKKAFDENSIEKIKDSALIVDYIGIYHNIQEALNFYWFGREIDDNEKKSSFIENPNEDVEVFKEKYLAHLNSIYADYYEKHELDEKSKDPIQFSEDFTSLLYSKTNSHLENFVAKVYALKKNYNVVTNWIDYNSKIKSIILFNIRNKIIKKDVPFIDALGWKDKLEENLKNAIIYEEIIPIIDNKKIINSKLLEEYIEKIKNDEVFSDKTKVQEIAKLLNDTLDTKRLISLAERKKISEKIKELVDKFVNGVSGKHEIFQELDKLFIYIQEKEEEGKNFHDEERLVKMFVECLKLEGLYDDKEGKLQEIAKKIYDKITKEGKEPMKNGWIKSNAKRKKIINQIKWVLLDEEYPPQWLDYKKAEVMEEIENFIDMENFD